MNKRISNPLLLIKRDLKKELEPNCYDKKEDVKTLLNILISFCYIGNALENFGKILISLVIIIMNTCLIEKNIKNIEFFFSVSNDIFFWIMCINFFSNFGACVFCLIEANNGLFLFLSNHSVIELQ